MRVAVVGAGLSGCTIARALMDRGEKVTIFERGLLGGNCRTNTRDGIEIHIHGPHVWHNSIKRVQEFMERFIKFNQYQHTKFVVHNGRFFYFPISFDTFRFFYLDATPEEIEYRKANADLSSFEKYLISIVGLEMYEVFYKTYSLKQWGTLDIPVDVAKRIPIRSDRDTNYFFDNYQALPDDYNTLFENMTRGIPIERSDYYSDREKIDSSHDIVVYTGALDELFGYDEGVLKYRSIDHIHKWYDENYHQPCATLNYSDNTPWVRSVEHKHFNNHSVNGPTVVTYEYAKDFSPGDIAYYPMWDYDLYQKYLNRVPQNMVLAGRLARYKYLDMNVAVNDALNLADKL